jgi:hypothetical protein
MEELKQKLESLEARATRLEQEIDNEPDEAKVLAKLAAVTALRNQITELQKKENILLEQSRGKFLFLRGEFHFLLEFVYFLWP